MTKIRIAPILIIIISFLALFFLVRPMFDDIDQQKTEINDIETALSNANEFEQIRNQLVAKYNSVSSENLDKLETMFPSRINLVERINELDTMAARHQLLISGTIENDEIKEQVTEEKNDDIKLRQYLITMSLLGSYGSIVGFVEDVARSLAVTDIVLFELEGGSFGGEFSDLRQYTLGLITYFVE